MANAKKKDVLEDLVPELSPEEMAVNAAMEQYQEPEYDSPSFFVEDHLATITKVSVTKSTPPQVYVVAKVKDSVSGQNHNKSCTVIFNMTVVNEDLVKQEKQRKYGNKMMSEFKRAMGIPSDVTSIFSAIGKDVGLYFWSHKNGTFDQTPNFFAASQYPAKKAAALLKRRPIEPQFNIEDNSVPF